MICKADFLKVLLGHFNLKAVREYYAQYFFSRSAD